jgi:2-polyprenyl-3-methyl-5-hydroxy-6-metoxy-1,4-benzoquinol methylase
VTTVPANWPMHRIGRRELDAYLLDDRFGEWLDRSELPAERELTCQQWLRATPPKRYAADLLYGDLLTSKGLTLLDIGGGLTSVSRVLAMRHRMTLVDLMAHDGDECVRHFQHECPQLDILTMDWFTASLAGPYDVVVAADLFPNVDQRLELFLERILPLTRELRLSLTVYNQPRFYLTRRVGADEVLNFLAWNGRATKAALKPYEQLIESPDFATLDNEDDVVFANGRQVIMLRMRGTAS